LQLLDSLLPGTTAWQSIATASGATATVNVAPSSGQNLSDGTYELSVAPMDFTSPARAYHIDASADTLVAPAVDSITPIALGTLLPTFFGKISLQQFVLLSAGNVYSFTAQATGPLTLEVSVPTVGTTLALYDDTGQTLLAARGRTTATGYTYTFDATAGTTYRTQIGPAVGSAGVCNLLISQTYATEALSVVSAPVSMPAVMVGGTTGAKFYRVALPKGIDALSVLLSPAGATGGNAWTTQLDAVKSRRVFGREIVPLWRCGHVRLAIVRRWLSSCVRLSLVPELAHS
jgi:hypothetical protein